ncbi:MAG: hypothetical protein IPM71_05630 [Bacteroidota bacterium]|nr:MAG: hypothetical protein IPM71_05630 [Bacteroidota bacterium]
MRHLIQSMFVLSISLVLFSCNDKVEESWEVNQPVYLSYDQLRNSFKVADEQDIVQSGKLYFKDNYIFVNEYLKGIHIIDNQDPSNPVILKFLEIPGNVDLAIAGNMLYADSYVDLLTIDISDINNIREVDRDTNIFPYIIPEFETGLLGTVDESQGVIVGYEVITYTEEVDLSKEDYRYYPFWEFDFAGSVRNDMVGAPTGGGETNFGVGGSMARFTLVNGYLYAIDKSSLKLFNIANIANPVWEKSIPISWNIETLFPYENKLFVGSQQGMYIYSIQNTSNPEYISEFRHANACDPVVVEGNTAYVTLRGGNLCGAIESQLNVIDITQIESPQLLSTYPMVEPYGMGIDNGVLFVCDGEAGLKIYNATDPMNISTNQLAHYPDIHAFDVIPLGEVLLMIGIDGLYQYDYSNLENITQLSHIPVYGE